MKRHVLPYEKRRSGGAALIFGTLTAIAATLVLTLIFALILARLGDPLGAIGGASLACLLLSGAISSFLTVRYRGAGGFASAALSALIIAALILIVSLIGNGRLGGAALMNILCYLAVSLLFAALAARRKERRRR